MMDWLGKILKLPEYYISTSGGLGGGVIQGTASEATLVCLLSARNKITNELKAQHKDWSEHLIRSKLVIYASEQVRLE